MADTRCPGCGMLVADPAGHLAHGMAQRTETPTFGGKSLDEVVREIEEKPKSKGGRPRKS